jgi:anti-sigma regulatory factor (Ser/Thr protein kinase)
VTSGGGPGNGIGAYPQVLNWHLESSAAAVGRMRQELGDALDRCDVPDDAHEVVLLVANELAVNAVEHVGGEVDVLAAFRPGSVWIAVSDDSPRGPRLRPYDPRARRGRGLQMVDGLASRWSWSADGLGKTVWAEVPTARSPGWA